jgi:hypothetical protein
VPAPDRNNLSTTTGLLFNEIIMSPDIVLSSIKVMLERVVEMDTGKYSELGSSILYVVRLAVRVEGYILFLMKNRQHLTDPAEDSSLNGAYERAFVRGLKCSDEVMKDALDHQVPHQYRIVPHRTALCCTVPHQYHIVPHRTALCCTVPHQYHIVPHRTALCCTVPHQYHIVLLCAVLCCTVLYRTVTTAIV